MVEDRRQLEKILSIKDQIPTLKAIVQYSGKPHVEGVITVTYCPFKSSSLSPRFRALLTISQHLFAFTGELFVFPFLFSFQWSQLMNLGNDAKDKVVEERLKQIAVNQCCTLIYTVIMSKRAFRLLMAA